MSTSTDLTDWAAARIRPEEIKPYLDAQGHAFVDASAIRAALTSAQAPGEARLQEIISKAMAGRALDMGEAAALAGLKDAASLRKVAEAAASVRHHNYGSSVSVFAPIFLGNACVNACSYCAFRDTHTTTKRRVLNEAEVRAEVEVLAGDLGFKRLLAVAGEHPSSDAKYIADSLDAIKAVQAGRDGEAASIDCVCVNAPPMGLQDLRLLRDAGADGYQVYQETYDQDAYAKVHPAGPKADYLWRLTAQHRAMDAGLALVGMGFLAGLADWRYELLATMQHAGALQARFGRGPATVTVQRIAAGHPAADPALRLDDEEFLHLVAVLRLALPAAGIIVPSSEGEAVRRGALQNGATDTDASTSADVGAFHEGGLIPASACRQFAPGQGGSLEELRTTLAAQGLEVKTGR